MPVQSQYHSSGNTEAHVTRRMMALFKGIRPDNGVRCLVSEDIKEASSLRENRAAQIFFENQCAIGLSSCL